MKESAKLIGLDPGLLATLKGAVFEVRQGYKSKDSKRQNADIANAVAAYTKAYLPCVVVLSTQIDPDVLLRYRAEKWAVITGVTGPKSNPQISTYDFAKDVVGYDLAGFFKKNQKRLKKEVDSALRSLLEVS